jgi:hypothetical protein
MIRISLSARFPHPLALGPTFFCSPFFRHLRLIRPVFDILL